MSEIKDNTDQIKKKPKTPKRNIAKLSDALKLNIKRRKQIMHKKNGADEYNAN